MAAPLLRLVGNNHTVEIASIRLLGVEAENGRKLLFTVIFLVVLYLIYKVLCAIAATLAAIASASRSGRGRS
ncbi:MAG TPA: hypothetical protein VN753_12260 [Terracidiphilus sp.]|nr:hypothetical protein [Terracidiphilus sp.]